MADQTPDPDDAPVVVAVVRSGGVAGVPRRWRVVPEPEDTGEWIALIERCPWDEPPVEQPGADRFVWRIRARTPEVEREREVADAELDGAWKALVAAVQRAQRRRGRRI